MEVRDFVADVKARWEQLERGRTRAGAAPQPVWSWDNAKIHGNVAAGEWADFDIATTNHTNLPPYSPDMHNVIEITHSMVTKYMQKFINTQAHISSDNLLVYTKELERIFATHITPQYIQSLTHRLYTVTLPAIVEAKGSYPPHSKR